MGWGDPRKKMEDQGSLRAVLEGWGSRGWEGNQEEKDLPASRPRPDMDAGRNRGRGKNRDGGNRPSGGNQGPDLPSALRNPPTGP